MTNIIIIGYGNLGRAVERQIQSRPNEFKLIKIFSRRSYPPPQLESMLSDISAHKPHFDVALFCGGSQDDAPIIMPELASLGISTVDSYDNHSNVWHYLDTLKPQNSTHITCAGWDPGFLSLQRILAQAITPNAVQTTLYGGEAGGLSMGHSNAVRNVTNVINAVQLTHTRPDALLDAQKGKSIPKHLRHKRVCWVVADAPHHAQIERDIKQIPEYFLNQEVVVNFISQSEFNHRFSNYTSHSGRQIATSSDITINTEITTTSNMDLTANIMLAYAKANHHMQSQDQHGVFTIADVPLAYLLNSHINII